MNKYAVAISTVNDTRQPIKVFTVVMLLKARSSEEAEGIALRRARKDWPGNQGWTQHNASVLEITDVWFET